MPFLLYDIENGFYQRPKQGPLAGKNGPLFRHMEAACPQRGGWHLGEHRLLELLGAPSPERSAVVIDLKPNVKENVSLFRLCDVWGYRDHNWSPLALRLEELYIDHPHPDPKTFKQNFRAPPKPGAIVHELLYLGKNWNWGMVGRVNGALLWPEAFEYLVAEITKT